MRIRGIVTSLVRNKNFTAIIIILLLLYGYLLLKAYFNYTMSPSTSTSNEEDTTTLQQLTVSYNLDRIKMYNLKKGDIFIPSSLKQRDWHNYAQIDQEKHQIGIGENGEPGFLPKEEKELEDKLFAVNGYNAALSDKISLNRSLPDFRHRKCKERYYLESLPTISVIISFKNEHLSVVLRTVYSVLNRSPDNLVKEIFLIDDGCTNDMLKEKLDNIVKEHLPKVKVIRLKTRSGLVTARLAGAKQATADVLIFMDSHTEVNVNWLPPLLEPIALDYRTVVIPLVDVIRCNTFEYRLMDEGARGAFDWGFTYKRIPMLPKDWKRMPEPFDTPILMGGHIAISRHFFWELGGYDPGMDIWGGEQYELSFKIWMCGGRILEAPCSRVGHLFRRFNPPDFEPKEGHSNYVARNFRRVALVWMDEYAEYLYLRRQGERKVDPGDISERIAIRKRLKCKPFKWFMTQIAFDFPQQFPLVPPTPYAEGRIRPVLNPHMCVDGSTGENGDPFLLKECYAPDVQLCPNNNHQHFEMRLFNDIRLTSKRVCWDVVEWKPGNHVIMHPCHSTGGNQQWRYFEHNKTFVIGKTICLDHNPHNFDLFVNSCDQYSVTQLFIIDIVHREVMKNWNLNNTVRVTGPVEEWKD